MEPTNTDPVNWDNCRAGQVRELVNHLHRRHRIRVYQRGIMAASIMLMIGFTGYYLFSEPTYGGIGCTKVHELAPELLAGRIDAETAGQIRVHLAKCEACQAWMKQTMPNAVPTSTSMLDSPRTTSSLQAHRPITRNGLEIHSYAALGF